MAICESKYYKGDNKFYHEYYYEASSNRVSSSDGYRKEEITKREYLRATGERTKAEFQISENTANKDKPTLSLRGV